jgi:lipopolysaccharide export system protein LptA
MRQMHKPGGFARDRICVTLLFLLLCGLAVGMPATAAATTLTVQSDHLDIWENKHQALFTGDVHLVREDFELFCDSLRAFYKSGKKGGGIDHALATGHVRMIQGDKHGTADSAVLDNSKQLVTLHGHAVMEQAGGRVAGETIVHNMVTKTTEVMPGESGRVRLRIDDKQVNAASSPAPAGKQGQTP